MAEPTGKPFDRGVLMRLLGLMRPYRSRFAFAWSLSVVLALTAAFRPWLMQYTIDTAVGQGSLRLLLLLSLAGLGALIAEVLMRYSFMYLAAWLSQSAIRDLRNRTFSHLIGSKLSFFDRSPVGMLTTRTISDIETIADTFSDGLLSIAADVLQLIAVLCFMLYVDWRLTLVSLSVLPVLLVASYWFKEAVRKSFQEVRTRVSEMNAFVQEHITGMQIVQIFNRQKEEYQRFFTISSALNQANLKGIFAYSVFFPIVEIVTAASLGLLVWYGANQALKGVVTIGAIVAFTQYINLLYRPIRMLADKFNTLQMGVVSSERVFKILDNDEHLVDGKTPLTAAVQGRIEFQNVWFAYVPGQWVIRDVSFAVQPGQTLALVGATGAGKSSIISVLSRFYDFQQGHVLLDGTDVRQIPLVDLHRHIGIILQDVFLFSGTLLDNITLRNPNIAQAKIEEMAAISGIDEFINRLPGGYQFEVRERGLALSSGQRQLVAFLRAMVYDPQILVLDEATASIDTETELLLQRATARLTQGRTSIVIAHRLSTITTADQIIVMERGEIAERGTHSQLMDLQGRYARLRQMQFSEGELV